MTERNVILQGVVGSTAYGLAGPDSDIDRLGIYVAPIEDVLGLKHDKAIDGTDVDIAPKPDKTLHEVGKYLSLALQCNPTVLELMWLNEGQDGIDKYEIKTRAGLYVLAIRKHCLSTKGVRARYGGYATAQAERLMRNKAEGKEGFSSDVRARTEKHGRHCARLLLQGADLLREGRVRVDVSHDRDFLFRTGELAVRDPDAFYERFLHMRRTLDNMDSVLPDEPDREKVNRTLIRIRLEEGGY